MAYKAFVSSTFEDLKEHRKQVIASLRNAGIFVDPMEDWTAASEEPKEFSQARIKECDICILLVGFRRGCVPKGEELSITQLEYKAAVDLGIDVLVFMLDEDSPWPRKFDEMDKDPLMRKWRSELKENRGVGFFGLEPTSIEIAPALTRWIADKRQGSSPLDKPEVLEVRHRLGTIRRSLGKAAGSINSNLRGGNLSASLMVELREFSLEDLIARGWGERVIESVEPHLKILESSFGENYCHKEVVDRGRRACDALLLELGIQS